MKTLDDLRHTLDTRVAGAPTGIDPDHLRGSIRRARRRRTALNSGLAVAAVASVVGLSALPSLLGSTATGPEPASGPLTQDAPAELRVLGLTYERASTDHSDGSRVVLEPDWGESRSGVSTPPVLSWNTQDPNARVEIRDAEGAVVWTSERSRFTDHVALDGVAYGPVTVSADSPGLGVAQYVFDPSGPVNGHAARGVVIPEQIGGQELIDSAISAPGETTVSATSSAASSGTAVTVSYHCSTSSTAALALTWGDNDPVVSECDSEPGVVNRTSVRLGDQELTAGETLTATVVRSAEDPTPVAHSSFADGVLAVAVYTAGATTEFYDLERDEVIEARGHRWALTVTEPGASSKGTHAFLDPQRRWLVSAAAASLVDQPDGVMRDHAVRLGFDGVEQPEPDLQHTPRTVSAPPTVVPVGTELAELLGEPNDQQADSAIVWAWELVDDAS